MINKRKRTLWITIAFIVIIVVAGLVVTSCTTKQEDKEGKSQANTTDVAEPGVTEGLGEAQKEQAKHPTAANEVSIATDKTEYKQGEVMRIIVRNGLDNSIWYLDAELGGWNPWWGLQKWEKSNWGEIKVHKPIDGECLIIVRERVPIEELIKELETKAERSDTWTLENCVEISPIGPETELIPLALGTYRLFFKYGLNKGSWNEKTVYSDKFVIRTD